MSRQQHVATPWRWAIVESKLDATAKLVLLLLSLFTDADGECDPSRELIAELAGRSVDTVDRALARAEAAGLVAIERSRGRTRNRYHVPTVVQVGLFGRWQQPQDESPTPANRGSNSRVGAARTSRTTQLDATLDTVGALQSVTARRVIEDFCSGCDQRKPLPDNFYCISCAAEMQQARATPSNSHLATRILCLVAASPGITTNKLCSEVKVRKSDALAELERLRRERILRVETGRRGSKHWYCVSGQGNQFLTRSWDTHAAISEVEGVLADRDGLGSNR